MEIIFVVRIQLGLLYMRYIWRTLSLANWNVMQIGRYLVWQIGLTKRNSLTIISVGGHKIWRLKPNVPRIRYIRGLLGYC